jgi:hypothetical protein
MRWNTWFPDSYWLVPPMGWSGYRNHTYFFIWPYWLLRHKGQSINYVHSRREGDFRKFLCTRAFVLNTSIIFTCRARKDHPKLTEIVQKCLWLSKHTDMTIHWKDQSTFWWYHLVFRFKPYSGRKKKKFSECFLAKTSVLNELMSTYFMDSP